MDPHYFYKFDLNPHYFQNSKALETQYRAVEGRGRSQKSHNGGLTAQSGALEGVLTRARIYRPSFRENMFKTLVFKTGSTNSGRLVADSHSGSALKGKFGSGLK
jgi:hypothetical protein